MLSVGERDVSVGAVPRGRGGCRIELPDGALWAAGESSWECKVARGPEQDL